MSLAQAIEQAHEQNARKLAAEISIPKQELDSEVIMQLRYFAGWCKSRGVKYLACAPTSVAAFIRSESAIGVPPERILLALRAIEQAHDSAGFANPVACLAPRIELARILKDDPPRSWAKIHHGLWASLPIECKEVIRNYADLGSKVLRRAQNENAELYKFAYCELNSIKLKGNDNGTSDQSRT